MLSIVLEFACVHLTPREWARLCRTNKEIRRAVSTPMYWDQWFGGLKLEVTEGRAMMHVYRSRECSCIGWDGVRLLPPGYTLSLPLQIGVSTHDFTRHLCEALQALNHDWLAHMSEAEISLRMPGLALLSPPFKRSHSREPYLVGGVGVNPVWIPAGTVASRESLEEKTALVMDDPGDVTYASLQEMAALLDEHRVVDVRAVVRIANNRGKCPQCARMFRDNGLEAVAYATPF